MLIVTVYDYHNVPNKSMKILLLSSISTLRTRARLGKLYITSNTIIFMFLGSLDFAKETRAPILPQLNKVTNTQNNSFDVSMSWNGAAWSIFNKFDQMASPALSIQLDECQFEEMTIPNATFRSGIKRQNLTTSCAQPLIKNFNRAFNILQKFSVKFKFHNLSDYFVQRKVLTKKKIEIKVQ